MPKKKSTEIAPVAPAVASADLSAHDLRRMIADLHGLTPASRRMGLGDEWALFFELRNGTGFGRQTRYVDCFAFNLLPSKSFWRVAYEIKVSRSDFLSELKKPEKRSFAMEISNEFFYVCLPGVAKPEEIPQGCGLMVVAGSKLKRVVQAPQRQARDLTMAEMAAIARSSCRYDILTSQLWRYQGCELDEEALNALVDQRKDEAFHAEVRRQVERDVESEMQNLRWQLETYAKALRDAGVTPPEWMTGTDRIHRGWGDRSARDWVRDHVKPGPNLKEVAAAISHLSNFSRTVDGLLQRLSHSASELQNQAAAALEQVKKLS